MKKISLLFLFCVTTLLAQHKEITLEDIWTKNTFGTESLNAFRPMKMGDFYTILEFDDATRSTFLAKYSYKTLELTDTIVNANSFPDLAYFDSYEFSDDEDKILLATQTELIYRYSSRSVFYIYDVHTKKLTLLTDRKVQEPTFSPDGTQVAYVRENNIYIFDIAAQKTTQITFDGTSNKIINGITDWVYEEEFAFVRAFEWSKDSKYIAFLRFDEAEVPEFSMDIYKKSLYPAQQKFKYPKAGEKNSRVTFHICHLENRKISFVDLGGYEYIPRIKATQKPQEFAVTTLNRHQNNLQLFLVTADKESLLILKETSDTYIDISDYLTFLEDNSFIWLSEKDGWNHLYHYNPNGKLISQITKGAWEVTNFYGYQPAKQKLFYQSTEKGSINRAVYSISINGKKKKLLTPKTGTNSASFSSDKNYFINRFSNSETAPVYSLCTSKGKEIKELKNNQLLQNQLSAYHLPEKEFSTIKVNDNELNMWMIKPANFDASKKYPLLMYQYSGPGSQSVKNSWNSYNDYWYYLLAQQGYIIACVDGRGTGYKGVPFKKVTYKELGKYEVEDQIGAAQKLGDLPYVDKNRIGIWGWSYGGFMSINCLLKGNDVFKMAIAVAPVTNWRFYDSVYTERYMQTPQENKSGYDDNSPINYVEKLKGNLLLVHGTADDNVHVQNAMQLIEALVQANKDFDWAMYPDKNHGIYGGNTRLHLYKKMTKYIEENL